MFLTLKKNPHIRTSHGWPGGRLLKVTTSEDSAASDQWARPLWINVASSFCVEKDFVNLDNDLFLQLARMPGFLVNRLPARYREQIARFRKARREAVLKRHDCRRPLPFPDGSADHILCSHFLEHVYPDEARAILADFRRVLKPGGTLHVIVPDLERLVHDYLEEKKRGNPRAADDFLPRSLLTAAKRESALFRFLEALGHFGLRHRWMYDSDNMGAMLEEVGFRLDGTVATPSDHVRADDGESLHLRAVKPKA